jgi:cytoskeletal protein CcmA (bactofilin family)
MAMSGWAAMKIRRQATKPQVPPPAVAPPATNGSDGHGKSVVLGPQDRLIGQLFVEGDLHVTGTVEGALEATGDIEIDGGGQVKGPVTAYHRLVVGSGGSLVGDVRVARLVIADGASFSGNVSMGKQPAAEPGPLVASPAAAVEPVRVVEPTPKPKKR